MHRLLGLARVYRSPFHVCVVLNGISLQNWVVRGKELFRIFDSPVVPAPFAWPGDADFRTPGWIPLHDQYRANKVRMSRPDLKSGLFRVQDQSTCGRKNRGPPDRMV